MNPIPPISIAVVLTLMIPLAVSAPSPEKTRSIPVAEFLITKAGDSNVRVGQRVGVGEVIQSSKGCTGQSPNKAGNVEATLMAWGIKKLILCKGTASIKSFALCAGGGRILELNVRGKADVQTRYLTQACSAVKICLGVGKGCVTLRSSANVREFRPEEYVIGVTEGQGIAQDADQRFEPVTINAGQYSFLSPNGRFSPPQSRGRSTGYRVISKTKANHYLKALDGYQILVGEEWQDTAQLPVGVTVKVRSPLD